MKMTPARRSALTWFCKNDGARRCQWRWCEGEALYSVCKPRWGDGPITFEFKFMCDEHYRIYHHAMTTDIKGIDRPDYADDDWRGSLIECVRRAQIAIAFDERNRRPTRPVMIPPHRHGDEKYTTAQLKQVQVLRSSLCEDSDGQ